MSDWVLHLGDCLDPATGLASLADKTVDHVICDPPYSDHVHSCLRSGASLSGGGGGKGDYRNPISRPKDLDFSALTDSVRSEAASHIARLCRRWSLVFSDVESSHLWIESLESNELEFVRTAFWHKLGGAPQFTGDRPAVACEAITIAHPRGKKRWNGGGKQGFYSIPIVSHSGETARHPTQKPERLIEALVRDFTDPGDLICDPFAGSGTTGVAAIRLGRRFIGWERDPKYHAIATKRLTTTREQLGLFAEGA